MKKNWAFVVVAAFFEVGWVVGLKHASNLSEWSLTALAIIISFYLMIMAGSKLAVGTVYAVFVGLGTTGTVFAEVLLFDAPVIFTKFILIMILLTGVISLKMLGNRRKKEVV